MGEIEFIGFVGETAGDWWRLCRRAPVVRIDGRKLIAGRFNWTVDVMHPWTESDDDYVHYFAGAPRTGVEGDHVWFAGADLVKDTEKLAPTAGLFTDWTPESEYSWAVGNKPAFDKFVSAGANTIDPEFRRLMAAAPTSTATAVANRIADSFHAPRTRDRELDAGWYAQLTANSRKLYFRRMDAIAEGLFADEDDFNRALVAHIRAHAARSQWTDAPKRTDQEPSE